MIEIDLKMENSIENTGYTMVYLASCALHGIIPDQSLVERIDLSVLYRLSQKHSLIAIVCMALESSNIFSNCKDVQLVKKWKETKEKAVRKNLMLDAERKEILNFMEGKGIWYLPLKGILLKDMYPKIGMRQMSDNDILYDKSFQKEFLTFMSTRGYKASNIGKGNHDVYKKEPVYNYELHSALYGTAHDSSWVEYYRDVKQRLIKDDGNLFGYHFSEEDFYIYIMTHNFKHYNGGGTGIRSLLDIYVFLQQKETGLNWRYVETELGVLGIAEYEQESKELCRKLFSENPYPLTQKELKTFTYYLGSGTYGTMKNSIEKKLYKYQVDDKPVTTITRIKYYFRRLIPDTSYYKSYVPFVYRNKWLIPFYLVFRLVRGLICKRRHIQTEIRLVHRTKKYRMKYAEKVNHECE